MKEIAVIVVDDEVNILNSLKRLFKDEDYGIFTTSDYNEALRVLDSEKIKVFLSDQRMPSINGVDLLNRVKELHPHTMRILFTGYTDVKIAEAAINKGEVYRFVNKPWDDRELISIIAEAIRHYDLSEKNRQLTIEVSKQNEELAALNEKLKAMYAIQKEFSSTVSHELRTPLSAMKALIDIVLSGTTGSLTPEQKDFLQRASANVDRLARLINDILNLEKLESGKAQLKLECRDLSSVIRETVEAHQPAAMQKQLSVKAELPPDKFQAYFDVDKISQVLNNLVSNAIKFTEKGEIIVSCAMHNDTSYVRVSVKDAGCGISVNDQAKLFQKFQQLGNPVERQAGGTGLGLAICKEIIAQHKGKIWVESELGQGSMFCFILPIQNPQINPKTD